MSTLAPQIRARLPRLADPAAVRSRLALVPPRAMRARRTPFVVLVFGLLLAGVVGLLLFNTQMQQGAFETTALQHRANALVAQQQGLQMQLQRLRDPQRLAQEARALGMVAPANPAFLKLTTGKVLGTPLAATGADGVHIRAFAANKPAIIAPKARVVHVVAPSSKANSSTSHGAASRAGAGAQGKNRVGTTSNGSN